MLWFRSNKDRVKQWVGAAPPVDNRAIEWHRHYPLPGYRTSTVYIRVALSEAAYRAWLAAAGLTVGSGPDSAHWYLLPAKWRAEPDADVPWWQPTITNPDTVATRAHGDGGWLIAKHEDGFAYIRIYDPHNPPDRAPDAPPT